MLLECLDAQGTFLQQSTFYSIGLPYEADEERGIESERGEGMGAERERGCKKIQVWRNIVKLTPGQMESLFMFSTFIRLFFCFCSEFHCPLL